MSTTSSQASPRELRGAQASQAQRTEDAQEAFLEALKNVTHNVGQEMQFRAKNIHAMDDALTKQEKELQKETKKLAKQNDEMQKFVDKSNKQLASFDDLDTIQADIVGDLEDIEEMLRRLEEDAPQRDQHR